MRLEILDSTLRDGAQGEGISFSAEDKLKIAESLDSFGVSFIEAGNPFSNPKDIRFFEMAAKANFRNAKLVAFGSTARKDIPAEEDEGVKALLSAGTKYVSVFGKAWDLHVDCILGTTLEGNLKMIYDTVFYLSSKGRRVIFDAEHFFDGYKANPDYAIEVLKTAEKAGARTLCLCDTNGGTFPDEIGKAVKAAAKATSTAIGIHCHNDNGCAVAGTIAAVKAGAKHIQGTFTGIGERCGNANLSTIIPDLQLKLGYQAVNPENMEKLTKTARYICEVANLRLAGTMPYVGTSAFAHKGGMHADGVAKNPKTFEHIAPELVGNRRNFLLSEVSGRSAILSKLHSFDETLNKNSSETLRITEKLKELECGGFQFEAAAASFELLALRELGRYVPHFEIDHYKIISSMDSFGGHSSYIGKANAIIKVRVGSRYEIMADEGDGPVNAIDRALRKALEVFYPELKRMRLIDYKVRVISTGESTASVTRVLIESTDGESTWTTVGASKDIINASMLALTDSLEYMLKNIPVISD